MTLETYAPRNSDSATSSHFGRIEEALIRRDRAALTYQRKRLTFAVAVSVLGPLAVLLLICHIVFFPAGVSAIIFVSMEVLTLTCALAIAFLRLDQSHFRWIEERLRAELLRREKFLLSAGVGPYLDVPDAALGLKVDQRLAVIDDDISDPVILISMDDGMVPWHEALEGVRSSFRPQSEIPALPEFLQNYLQERIVNQRQWFSRKAIEHGEHMWWLEGGSKMTLTFALIVAAIHLGFHGVTPQDQVAAKLLTVSAVFLPTSGAAILGLLSIFGCHRLARSYRYHAQALERLENKMRTLQAESLNTSPPQNDVQLRFRRLLLDTEDLLSHELRIWWLFFHPELPRASG